MKPADIFEVSWLLPVNRYDPILPKTILHCISQTNVSAEVIVVVNGSLAGQLFHRLSQLYSHIESIRIFSADVDNIADALNAGIAHARGEFIARIDSDDYPSFHRLAAQLAFIRDHPCLDIVGSWMICHIDGLSTDKVLRFPVTTLSIQRSLYLFNPLAHPSLLIRRSIFNHRIRYSSRYPYAEDYALWVSIHIHYGLMAHNLPLSLTFYSDRPLGSARSNPVAYFSMSRSAWNAFRSTNNFIWFASSILFMARVFISVFQNKLQLIVLAVSGVPTGKPH